MGLLRRGADDLSALRFPGLPSVMRKTTHRPDIRFSSQTEVVGTARFRCSATRLKPRLFPVPSRRHRPRLGRRGASHARRARCRPPKQLGGGQCIPLCFRRIAASNSRIRRLDMASDSCEARSARSRSDPARRAAASEMPAAAIRESELLATATASIRCRLTKRRARYQAEPRRAWTGAGCSSLGSYDIACRDNAVPNTSSTPTVSPLPAIRSGQAASPGSPAFGSSHERRYHRPALKTHHCSRHGNW